VFLFAIGVWPQAIDKQHLGISALAFTSSAGRTVDGLVKGTTGKNLDA